MEKIRIFALGGLDEDGKNMYVVEVGEDIFIIEAGIKYPESTQLGVEFVIPDFTYVIENKDRVRGIFVSHAHDDAMAALPYLLKQLDVPVYTTPLNALIIQAMLSQHGIKRPTIKKIKRTSKFTIGSTTILTFATTHSVGESFGLAFQTSHGYIVYMGEFIVDYDARDEAFSCDISRIADIGNHNVLCLLQESVGAARKGHTAPLHKIRETIEPYFENSEGRIIISVYAQNLYRAMEVLTLAIKYKKRVAIFGDELKQMMDKVVQMGHFAIPKDLLVEADKLDPEDTDMVIIISASGPNIFRLMHKIVFNEDDALEFTDQDTVIIASPIVPGTEKEAGIMENELYKTGAKIVTLSPKQVYSMHASQEDLKMMMYLLKPKYYLPIKGEYRQLIENANLATNMGMTPDRIIVLDNGQVASFEKGILKSTAQSVPVGETLIDGSDEWDLSGYVIKDREQLSTDGVIIVGVVIDYKTKQVVGGPDVQMRGFIYLKEADHIISTITQLMENAISEAVEKKKYENMACRMDAKERIQKYVLKETGKRPMILPSIIEINL